MKVDNQIVIFENADMHFIKKYGIQVATDMVLNAHIKKLFLSGFMAKKGG